MTTPSKRRREGTLTERDWRSLDADEFDTAALANLGDFLDKAEKIGAAMKGRSDLADRRARRMLAACKRLRGAAQFEHLEMVIYDAIEAALVYTTLRAELRDDLLHGKLTRRVYFANKKIARNRTELASLCGMTLQGLRKWEAANLE